MTTPPTKGAPMAPEPHHCVDDIRQQRWTNPATGRIVAHPYEASPHSGAGNCWCGRDQTHRLHTQGGGQ